MDILLLLVNWLLLIDFEMFSLLKSTPKFADLIMEEKQ